jgi:hypothetical protein
MRRTRAIQLFALAAMSVTVIPRFYEVTRAAPVPPAASHPPPSSQGRPSQPAREPTAEPGRHSMAVEIDGSQRPSDIPDEVAHKLYMKALALRNAPSGGDVQRRDAFLRRIHLPEADQTAFVDSIQGLGRDLAAIEGRRRNELTADKGGSAIGLALRSELTRQEDKVLDATMMRLRTQMSDAGFQQLDQHVQTHVKSRIKIYHGANHDAH